MNINSVRVMAACACKRVDASEPFCDYCFKAAIQDWERDQEMRRQQAQAKQASEDKILVDELCKALNMPLKKAQRAFALLPAARDPR